MTQIEHSERLVQALRTAGRFGHAVDEVEVMETHISWVLLAGEFAYKIKKPLRFDFLDFSTLERRRFFCGEELRLNRRFAPAVYLDVVPITGDPGRPEVSGGGEACEYAVKMRRFRQEDLLDEVAARGLLGAGEIDALGAGVGLLHEDCARADAAHDFGQVSEIRFWVQDNFAEILPLVAGDVERTALEALEQWSARKLAEIAEILDRRRAGGFVRECHGDLHLRNIVMIDGRPVPFDCIEFNEALRWIDVMSEVAFLVMDLDDHGYRGLAHRFLNAYLRRTGDYAGVAVLDYYLVYRAMVRAKVAAIRIGEGKLAVGEEHALRDLYRSYVDLATCYTERSTPVLVLMHGLSGSGKSTLAARLAEEGGMIQLRSDVERKRMFGLTEGEGSGSGLGSGMYSPRVDAAVYARLLELACTIWKSGRSVIVDATFLRQAQRAPFLSWAREARAAFVVLDVQAPAGILRERVKQRQARGGDPSEATPEVLERQFAGGEPLADVDVNRRVVVDSSCPLEAGRILEEISRRAAG